MALPRLSPLPLGLLVLPGVYFVVGKLGLILGFSSSTAVWPPAGIALAAPLLLGYRVWPAVFVGSFLVNVTTEGSVWTTLGVASGNTLEGLLGAFLVTRFAGGRNVFGRARDILVFAALAGLLGTAVSATIGVTSLALGGYASWGRFGAIWLTWWLGDVAGALVVAPALILWGRRAPDLERRDLLGLALLLLALALTGAVVFGHLLPPWVRGEQLEFLCIPALMWAAFRYRQRGAATSLAVLAGIAVWGTLHGAGPFVRETQNESLLLLQAFLVTLALTILPLAAVVRERARAEEELARLAAIVESSDHELPMILDRLGRGERIDYRETVRVRRDGRRIDVSITVSPTRDPYGRITGAASIARDIGHRREVEIARRERDVLRSVAGLTAAVGHEINNPLAVVMGQAQLLARQVGDGERRRIDEMLDAVERIRETLERMKHINKIVILDGSETLPSISGLTESSPP